MIYKQNTNEGIIAESERAEYRLQFIDECNLSFLELADNHT